MNWHLKAVFCILAILAAIFVLIATGVIRIGTRDGKNQGGPMSWAPVTEVEKPKALEPLIDRLLKEGVQHKE